MNIHKVENKADLKRFIELPYQLYKNDPIWVPPLRREQWAQFDRTRNPMLDHCEYVLFLLEDKGQVIGRISAFTDQLALEHWQEPIGLFGSYECIDDAEGSRLLLDTARSWLQERGMKTIRGPWSFASQEWGMVLEGFEPPPVILAPYNPPYYNDHLTAFGMEKAKDLLVYYVNLRDGYRIPERYLTLTDKIQQRYGVHVRAMDMSQLEQEVALLVDLANCSISDNWGFYPVTADEARAMAHDLKDIINPEAALIAEDRNGEAIGFSLPIPDVNVLLHGLNGRLMPFGWLKLLLGISRLRNYRLWALGVVPEYQGKAVDALLYRRTYEVLKEKLDQIEINYVLEDNTRMNNALKNLGVKDLRRYRVYQMTI